MSISSKEKNRLKRIAQNHSHDKIRRSEYFLGEAKYFCECMWRYGYRKGMDEFLEHRMHRRLLPLHFQRLEIELERERQKREKYGW